MKHYWLPHELEACWSLAADEEALLAGRTELNRLACAASLKFFQIEGRFPGFPGEIPQQALAYLAEGLDVSPRDLDGYDFSSRTHVQGATAIRSLEMTSKSGMRGRDRQVFDNLEAVEVQFLSPRCQDDAHAPRLRLTINVVKRA
jgi:uncharacterized protein DUF4158